MGVENVIIERLPSARDLPLPERQTPGSSGYDLYAACQDPVGLAPGERAAIPTGIRLQIPEGMEAQIRPRSGLALRHGVAVLNTPGTIDSDYRGEVKVILINLGSEDFVIRRGDRIAQLVFARVEHPTIIDGVVADDTTRGSGGFGHTGGFSAAQ